MTSVGRSMGRLFFLVSLFYLYMAVEYALDHEVIDTLACLAGFLIALVITLWVSRK